MIQLNNQKVGSEKIKNKVGGDANESRFYATKRELRTPKSTIISGASGNGYLKVQQAWNKQSREADVVKITLRIRNGRDYLIVTREELEQAVSLMAQGMETIKYCTPRTQKM